MIQTNCTDITGNCIISSHPLRRHSSGRMEAVFSGGFEVAAAAAAHTSETKLAKAETDFAGSDFGNADDGGDALLT